MERLSKAVTLDPNRDPHTYAEAERLSSDAPNTTNPLAHLDAEGVMNDADIFVEKYGLADHREAFRKGALLAKAQLETTCPADLPYLSQEEKSTLQREVEHPYKSIPGKLYFLSGVCAGCAVVQGMDQTIINGAQEFYFEDFGITDPLMKGVINGSPYIAAALIGCWLNAPLNKLLGRRGTIFISTMIAFATTIWQAAAPNWIHFIIARLLLGIAVGAKSSTVPVYAAECAPAKIRGALTMMWQTFTAFGIMLGYAVSLALQHADFMGPNSQWRWMMGVTSLPPLIVGTLVYIPPESPRWYMDRAEFAKAWTAIRKLRIFDYQAARDLYLAYKLLRTEDQIMGRQGAVGLQQDGRPVRQKVKKQSFVKALFSTRRNWRAAQSAWFCMFMQQFCGVNVIAYYSTNIFIDAGFSRSAALGVSFGCGALNFIGAIPALYTIDKYGRRRLLLTTFPFLAFFLILASATFQVANQTARIAGVSASIYLFMLAYSPGMGPVPFTYSAEAFPLYIRANGMASATSITWAFNFLISFSWPAMSNAMTSSGGLAWYAAWNIFGWVFTYFFLPETKGHTLEELDVVFIMRNREHVAYYWQKWKNTAGKVCGKDVEPLPPLYGDSEVKTNIRRDDSG